MSESLQEPVDAEVVEGEIVSEPEVTKWRKKPVTVEAILFTGSNEDEVLAFVNDRPGPTSAERLHEAADALYINTLEGTMRIGIGDYVIRGIGGECYPCKPEIFHESYEPMPS